MRKLDAGSYRTMPWKNGGGSTTEIARAPAGESLEDFDWRISIARVAAAGPFSRFAGVDRSIVVLEGEGILLEIEGRGETRLDRGSPPFAFAADVLVMASLTGGAILDFNVMTRRGRYRHQLTRARYDKSGVLPGLGDATVVFVVEGNALAEAAGSGRERAKERIGPHDSIVVEGGGAVAITPLTPAPRVELLAVGLWRD